MITLDIKFTLNNKSYSDHIMTKGSFSIDSIKREICESLIYDEINPDENIKENIKENIMEDIRQLMMNNIIITSIEIIKIDINEHSFIETTINEKVLQQPDKYMVEIVNDK